MTKFLHWQGLTPEQQKLYGSEQAYQAQLVDPMTQGLPIKEKSMMTWNQLSPDQQSVYGNEQAYNTAVSTAQSVAPPVPGSRAGQLQQAGVTTQGTADPSEFIQAGTGLQYAQPTLPTGTKITPELQQVQTPEVMATGGVGTTAPTAAAPTAAASTAAAVAPPSAVQVDPTAFSKQYQTYTAQAVGTAGTPQTTAQVTAQPTQTISAQQGTIASNATVSGQLDTLQQQVSNAIATGQNLPAWASGAQKLVEANMAKRGMGASSMYAEALAQGVMSAAVPIAAADAQTYKEMIFANLSNRQQAAVQNAQNYLQLDTQNLSNKQQSEVQNATLRHNTLLTDQAAQNASGQFNAQSQQQTDTFFDNLVKEIKTNNAQRGDAMGQFSSAEQNKIAGLNANSSTQIADANAQREAAINQFNSQLSDARERFNVENQRVIDQSNVVWRRNVNTANTAQINAANQTNAANLLNTSNFSMSALWQQWRDEAQWAMQSSQNEENRAHNIAVAAMGRQTAFDLNDQAMNDELHKLMGQFAVNLLLGTP